MNPESLLSNLIPFLGDQVGDDLIVRTPIDGSHLASLAFDSPASIEYKIDQPYKLSEHGAMFLLPKGGNSFANSETSYANVRRNFRAPG